MTHTRVPDERDPTPVWRTSTLRAVATYGATACLLLFVLFNLRVLVARSRDQVALRQMDGPVDPVSASDAVFERIKPLLPATGTVGYLKQGFDRANLDDLAGLFRAQFSLAPLLVDPDTMHESLVAVASKDDVLPDVPAGYVEAQRLSAQVAVYRRLP